MPSSRHYIGTMVVAVAAVMFLGLGTYSQQTGSLGGLQAQEGSEPAQNSDSSPQSSTIPVSGGEMSGNLDMGGNSITGLAIPEKPGDAATKEYVDENDDLEENTDNQQLSLEGYELKLEDGGSVFLPQSELEDTNASTACEGDRYLGGDGECHDDSSGGGTGTLSEVLSEGNKASTSINLDGNSLTNVGQLKNFFASACQSREAITKVYDNGSYVCESFSSGSGTLTEVLEVGNTANRSINMSGNNITAVDTVKGQDDLSLKTVGKEEVKIVNTGSNAGPVINMSDGGSNRPARIVMNKDGQLLDGYLELSSASDNLVFNMKAEDGSNVFSFNSVGGGRLDAFPTFGSDLKVKNSNLVFTTGQSRSNGIRYASTGGSGNTLQLFDWNFKGSDSNSHYRTEFRYDDDPILALDARGNGGTYQDAEVEVSTRLNVTGNNVTGVGSVRFNDNVSIGNASTNVGGPKSLAIGKGATTDTHNGFGSSVAIGRQTNVGGRSVGIGTEVKTGTDAVVIGKGVDASGSKSSVIIGANAVPGSDGQVTIGKSAEGAWEAVTIGKRAESSGKGAVAIGYKAYSPNAYEVTLGNLNSHKQDLNVTGNTTIHGDLEVKGSCTGCGGSGGTENLSQTLTAGNVANQSINMSGNDLRDTGNITTKGGLYVKNASGSKLAEITEEGSLILHKDTSNLKIGNSLTSSKDWKLKTRGVNMMKFYNGGDPRTQLLNPISVNGKEIQTRGSDITFRDTSNTQDIIRLKEGGNVEIPNGNLEVSNHINFTTGSNTISLAKNELNTIINRPVTDEVSSDTTVGYQFDVGGETLMRVRDVVQSDGTLKGSFQRRVNFLADLRIGGGQITHDKNEDVRFKDNPKVFQVKLPDTTGGAHKLKWSQLGDGRTRLRGFEQLGMNQGSLEIIYGSGSVAANFTNSGNLKLPNGNLNMTGNNITQVDTIDSADTVNLNGIDLATNSCGSSNAGDMARNQTDNELYYCDGTAWEQISP